MANIEIYENDTILINEWEYINQTIDLFDHLLYENKIDLDSLIGWVFMKGSLEFLPQKYKYDGSFVPELNVTFIIIIIHI
jgi:hypothetical protein